MNPIESYPENLPLLIQKEIRDRLMADPYFAEHRVSMLLQDEGEIATLIEQQTLPITGPLLVIAVGAIEANSPGVSVAIELLITEHPVTNRARAGFDTALGVAWHAATLLNGDTFLFERITHLLNEDGTFQAVVSLRY